MSDDLLDRISSTLGAHGLILRGGLNLASDDYPPARAVLLVGHAGADYWQHFSAWRDRQPSGLAHPLDGWSRTVLETAAGQVGARVLMPNDRPFAPFQQWAMRAEGLAPSPLGLLVHPRYGLWHAWRGALLLDREIAAPPAGKPAHPCDACDDRPCLTACPVGAHSLQGFAYQSCVTHVRGAEGAACRTGGCVARNACPVGAQYRYPAEVQAFHQRAFAGL